MRGLIRLWPCGVLLDRVDDAGLRSGGSGPSGSGFMPCFFVGVHALPLASPQDTCPESAGISPGVGNMTERIVPSGAYLSLH